MRTGGCWSARRLPEGLEGVTRLHALIAAQMPEDWAELDPGEAAARVKVGIETDRGSWVAALVAAGYEVFAINPMSVARYRERHSTSGAKSDAGDAHVLAEIVRLDRAHHRPVAGDSDLGEAIKLVARSHQTLIWDRTRHVAAAAHDPAGVLSRALVAFDDLDAPDALELLAGPRIRTGPPGWLEGDRGGAETRPPATRRGPSQQLQNILRAPELRQPPVLQTAFAAIVASEVAIIAALNTEIDRLGAVVGDHFGRHRDAEIYASQPGLGVILGARILGEFGDDPDRYADAKARKNYAGTSPITRASGTKKVVLARYARNRDSPTPSSNGRSAHCADHQEPPPTTTAPRPQDRPPSRAPPARQPPRRHPARLPEDPHPLRRNTPPGHTTPTTAA